MTELEKLENGLEFDFWDKGVEARKMRAIDYCERLNAISATQKEAREAAVRELFGSCGKNPSVMSGFNCDNGLNIHVGDNFLANFNVTILDVLPVYIGDDVMIAPGAIITTVGHPISPKGRRNHLAVAKGVTIENNVWIGGGAIILPGVKVGENSIIAAGAVVNKDVPSNCIVAGVPARVIRVIDDDTQE